MVVVLGMLLLWMTFIVAILTVGLSLSGSARVVPIAKLCRVLAFVVAGAAFLNALQGMLDANETLAVPILHLADRQRIQSSMLTDALYGIGLGLLIAVPVWFAAHFALKRAGAQAPD